MATTVTTTPVTSATPRHGYDPHGANLHGAAQDAVHRHGDMDAGSHERTFDGFVRFLTWNAVAIIVILIFLALAGA